MYENAKVNWVECYYTNNKPEEDLEGKEMFLFCVRIDYLLIVGRVR